MHLRVYALFTRATVQFAPARQSVVRAFVRVCTAHTVRRVLPPPEHGNRHLLSIDI